MRLSVLFLLMLSSPGLAQPAVSTRDSGDAVHLFAYWPKEGQKERFDECYRAHLQWHRDHRDPLVWYGWYVSSGERIGMFIDGSFGAPFAAFDQRVAPKDDAADAVRTFVPHAADAFRASYRLRREFSTGFPLEQWKPSKNVQVFHYMLHPGTQARFERFALASRDALLKRGGAPVHTWYEEVVGGAPGFMLMVARDDWKSYDAHGAAPETLVAPAALEDFTAAVAEVRSEIWSYREDLSLIPAQ